MNETRVKKSNWYSSFAIKKKKKKENVFRLSTELWLPKWKIAELYHWEMLWKYEPKAIVST